MIKTNFNQSERRLRVTVAVLLISVITMLPLGFSQTVKAQTPSKASARAESKGGQVEGIKVHGHWTIDVRNPDGKLVMHREFENALTAHGGELLSQILGRLAKPSLWQINLVATTFGSPWSNNPPGGLGFMVEPNDQKPIAPNVSKNLSLCVGSASATPCPDGGPRPPLGTFLLSGNIAASQNGFISGVGTYLFSCPPDLTGLCIDTFSDFTYQPLAQLVNGSCPPNTQCIVNVVARQIIQVTVAITFS